MAWDNLEAELAEEFEELRGLGTEFFQASIVATDWRLEYQARKASGRCVCCYAHSTHLNAKGRRSVVCQDCLRKLIEYNAAARRRRRAAGLCYCGHVPDPGYRLCGACKRSSSASKKRKRDARRAAGLCPSCGSTPETGYVYCPKCIGVAKGYYAQKKVA